MVLWGDAWFSKDTFCTWTQPFRCSLYTCHSCFVQHSPTGFQLRECTKKVASTHTQMLRLVFIFRQVIAPVNMLTRKHKQP